MCFYNKTVLSYVPIMLIQCAMHNIGQICVWCFMLAHFVIIFHLMLWVECSTVIADTTQLFTTELSSSLYKLKAAVRSSPQNTSLPSYLMQGCYLALCYIDKAILKYELINIYVY